MRKIKRLFTDLLFALFGLFGGIKQAFAQVSISDQYLLKPQTKVAGTFPTLGSFISTILPNAYILAGLILLFLFLFGGFTIISSADNPEQKQKGMQTLTTAIIGFVIIFASYWIIQIIQILTGVQILNSTL